MADANQATPKRRSRGQRLLPPSGRRRSLGLFNSCEGLGLEVVIEQREEGGNNGFVWQLPTRIMYSNVKLSRPVGKDSAFDRLDVSFSERVKRQTAIIIAMTGDRDDGRHLDLTGLSQSAGSDRVSAWTARRWRWRPSSSPTTASCQRRADTDMHPMTLP